MKSRALVLGVLLLAAPNSVRADAPLETLMSGLEALGPAREGEADRYTQLESALVEAERAEAAGLEARARRHRELAEALMRGIESARHAMLVRTQLEARRQALAEARARLEAARARHVQGEAEHARTEAGTH